METKGILLGLLVSCMIFALTTVGFTYNAMPTPEDMGLNYSINAGFVSSVNSNVNNGTRPTVGFAWYGAAEPAFGDMAAFGLSADWIGIQRNDGSNVSLIPITFNYKQSAIVSAYRVFVTVGVGIRVATGNISEMRTNEGTTFGWTGGIGIDLTNQFFAQARFFGGEHPGQDGLASVQIGYRF